MKRSQAEVLRVNHDKTVSMIIHPAFSEAMSVSSGGSTQPVIAYNGHCVTQVNSASWCHCGR